MNFIGMDFHFSSNDIGASFNVQSAQKLDLELGLDFFKNTLLNGQEAHLTPTFTHCGDVPWITDHLGGTNNLYVFHAGTGPYPKKKAHAKYHTCRDIIVENGSTEPIEIPITIQGSVWASVQTFANNTYARSKLRVWGSVGGQPFDQSAAVEATSIFPESQDINVTSRYVVSPGQGRNAVHLEINAESLTETQAKGGGLWGMLSSAATGGADFPSGITVGNFTGTGGKPLPTGIRVYDAADMKTVYANTAPVLEVLPPSVSESRLRIFAPTNCACTILVSTNMTNWSQLLSTNLGPGACILSETKSNAVTTKFYRLSMP